MGVLSKDMGNLSILRALTKLQGKSSSYYLMRCDKLKKLEREGRDIDR